MEQDTVKRGLKLAQDELREKQVAEVKQLALRTLEKLDELEKQITELNEQRKLLKLDLEDLKEGRLDRILERQEKDPKAKKVSVFTVIKEKETVYVPYGTPNWWYTPYVIETKPSVWCQATSTNNSTIGGSFIGGVITTSDSCSAESFMLNGSVTKDACRGTYTVHNSVVHLR
jgi:regulator of replication initiation timing